LAERPRSLENAASLGVEISRSEEWVILKLLAGVLKLLMHKQHMTRWALIGCPTRTQGPLERERGACTVSPWNTLVGDGIHLMNKPIKQRYNQLPSKQEIKSL
jgi:hypothetical protein